MIIPDDLLGKTFTIDVVHGDEVKTLSRTKYKVIGKAMILRDEIVYEYFNLKDDNAKNGLTCYILNHLEGFPYWIQSEPVFIPTEELVQTLNANNCQFDD